MGNCQKESSDLEPSSNDRLRTGPMEEMQITCITWNKDYQGLFDYESKQITKIPLTTKQSGILMKMGNEFKIVNQLTKSMVTENPDKFLFKFIKRPDCFHIEPLAIQTSSFVLEKNLWMVVKSTPNHEYSLREGDMIKLGRQKIRIREKIYGDRPGEDDDRNGSKEINCTKTLYTNLVKSKTVAAITASNFNQALQSMPEQFNKTNLGEALKEPAADPVNTVNAVAQVETKQGEGNQEPLCRICLDPGLTSNPLITPCKCAGTMRYIHLVCLQMWLGKRLSPITQPHCITINWKPLLCQLCMSHFLYKIYLDNKKYYTVQIPRPPKPYLVMQIIHKDKSKKKVYSLVSFADKKKLNLGRKHDTDVKISDDISVSRHHSSIRYEEKDREFLIEDASSKFGTLILIKKRLVVRDISNGLAIQVGPNVFQFKVKRAFGPPGQVLPVEDQDDDEGSEEEYDDDAAQEEEGEEEQVEEQPANIESPNAVQREGTRIHPRPNN